MANFVHIINHIAILFSYLQHADQRNNTYNMKPFIYLFVQNTILFLKKGKKKEGN